MEVDIRGFLFAPIDMEGLTWKGIDMEDMEVDMSIGANKNPRITALVLLGNTPLNTPDNTPCMYGLQIMYHRGLRNPVNIAELARIRYWFVSRGRNALQKIRVKITFPGTDWRHSRDRHEMSHDFQVLLNMQDKTF